ncbi:hypothetical protein [Methylobacterium haplocladii]|uniref:Uncharacterized protein n=1 Tax=Methylobacterium haplocladii TaxID=1176176 RepID=A0A512IW49_9HYPH|nr:hypothetical protein [Methylobacterium haplocladii]GEP01932.1 hypothetical protein MHA02_43190 [Methylobacterium haplocladii]GLS61372.1 hypothetical protein GCM10007887_40800 [Methylobacterium haplocladii]
MGEDDPIELNWRSVPASNPVERVARALCAHDGLNPDTLVFLDRRERVVGHDGIAEMRPATDPAWKRYAKEAGRLVAAFEAYQEV